MVMVIVMNNNEQEEKVTASGKPGADERELIITADDLGYSEERTLGIINSYLQGVVTQASLIVNSTHTAHAVQLAKRHGLPCGLHLNLTEGVPISSRETVSSLLSEREKTFKGKFGLREAVEVGVVRLEEISLETQAQIILFTELMGYPPLSVDGHQHIHVLPRLAVVISPVFASLGVQFTRIAWEPSHIASWIPASTQEFYRKVFAEGRDSRQIYERAGIATTGLFIGCTLTGSEGTLPILSQALRALPSKAGTINIAQPEGQDFVSLSDLSSDPYSLVEFMTHPGYVTDPTAQGLITGAPDAFAISDRRETELRMLTSPEVRALLRREGFRLCSFSTSRVARHRYSMLRARIENDVGDGTSTGARGISPTTTTRAPPPPLVALISSLNPASGNFVTALRLRKELREMGYSVMMLDTNCVSAEEAQQLLSASWWCGWQWEAEVNSPPSCRTIASPPAAGTTASANSPAQWVEVCQTTALAMGLHALRAGRLLLPQTTSFTRPYVIVVGGTDLNEYVCDVTLRDVIVRVLRGAAGVVTFSEEMRGRARELLECDVAAPGVGRDVRRDGETVHVIPQAVDIDVREDVDLEFCVRRRMHLGDSDVLLLLPLGLRPVKDPMFLLDALLAWRGARGDRKRVHLLLVGSRRDDPAFADQVLARLGLVIINGSVRVVEEEELRVRTDGGTEGDHPPLQQPSISDAVVERFRALGVGYLPALPRPALLKAMRSSDAVVNCSRSEGMPNALLEAMAIGTLVIARDIPGNRCLISPDTSDGSTAAPADPADNGILFQTPQDFTSIVEELFCTTSSTGVPSPLCSALGSRSGGGEHTTPGEVYRKNGLEFVRRHHSPDMERAAYAALLSTLLPVGQA